MPQSSQEQPYAMAEDPGELGRLTLQHQMLKAEMGHTLVFAPIDFHGEALKVLDSGCANGLWLRDLCSDLPNGKMHNYTGIDIEAAFFPESPEPWLQLVNQSMQRPFPSSWENQFDLVHMRFGLPATVGWGPKKVVSNLVSVLKLSGWIQLVEADWIDVSNSGPVLNETFSLFCVVFQKMGISADFTQKLEGWMEEEGLKNIRRKTFHIRIGARAEDRGLGNAGTAIVCQAAATIIDIAKRLMPEYSSNTTLQTLVPRLREELDLIGGSYHLDVVYGQKI
ncbi:hypothetical protein ANO14919_040720 [Xylariales sp. No.14919]|nr:hypothetical protein ANO14919_040720 [Xylariales sp. No.14919]